MASPLERVFFIRFDARSGTETAWAGGARKERAAHAELVVRARAPLSRALDVLGLALRATGLLLLASPLLLVVKVVLAAAVGPRVSDVVIPFFVIVVVAFFGLLNVSLLVFFAHWLLRKRVPPPAFVQPSLGAAAPPTESTAVGRPVRARGRVVALDATLDGKVVLRSADAVVGTGAAARLVEMRCFAVIADDDRTPPVIVHGPWAPAVAGPALEPAAFGSSALGAAGYDRGAFETADAVVVRAGDRVEVTGVVDAVVPNADHFELDGAVASLPRDGDEPYRGGAPRVALAVQRVVLVRS
jgi:hypothetical protein